MFERYSENARKAMSKAAQEAQKMGHDHIGTEHLLLGLIEVKEGFAAEVLEKEKIDLAHAREKVVSLVENYDTSQTSVDENTLIHRTLHAQTVINDAVKEARALKDNKIGTEHLLLGLLYENEGTGAKVIQSFGLKLDDVRDDVLKMIEREKSKAC